MGVLQRFERRVENLVNGAFARAFKAEVQPVEVAAALARECDNRKAIVARGRTMVPNSFVVELGPHDFERLNQYAGALGTELSDLVRGHADEQGYAFLGPVTVALEGNADLDTGVFRVRSAALAPGAGRAARRPRAWLEVGDGEHPLTSPVTVVGRGSEADVRIDDPSVSRRHAELRLLEDGAILTDLGSTNGLVQAGKRVDQVRLGDGDVVELGSTRIVFRSGPRESATR